MARYFTVTGTCYPDEHYMVDPDKRLQIIEKMIKQGKYITINRARQYGKTTTLWVLQSYLQKDAVRNYELYHKLQNEIELFMKVVKCLSSRNYFKIIGIGIKERDRIVCDTLPKLYRCFEKNMFGDIAYKFHQQGKSAKSYVVNSNSCFCIDSFVANVDRKVVRGQFEDKESYMGILEIEVMDIIDDIDDMDKVLSEIKKVCFDIFLNHITDTMVMDLLNGETKLIKEEFNKNE